MSCNTRGTFLSKYTKSSGRWRGGGDISKNLRNKLRIKTCFASLSQKIISFLKTKSLTIKEEKYFFYLNENYDRFSSLWFKGIAVYCLCDPELKLEFCSKIWGRLKVRFNSDIWQFLQKVGSTINFSFPSIVCFNLKYISNKLLIICSHTNCFNKIYFSKKCAN